MDWVVGAKTEDGSQGIHPRTGGTATRTEGGRDVHCRALGIGGSGHNCGKDRGRGAHSLGLSSCVFQVSGLRERIMAPTHSFGDRAEALGILSLLATGAQGPGTTGQRDQKIYSLTTSTTGTYLTRSGQAFPTKSPGHCCGFLCSRPAPHGWLHYLLLCLAGGA